MSHLVRPVIVLALVLSLNACSWNKDRSQTLGAVVGGIVGAVVGSQLGSGTGRAITTVLGTTLGTMWGSDVAEGLSSIDTGYFERTTQDTLEYGKPGEQARWSNPDSGNFGTVTPDQTFTDDSGQNCRQFETTVTVDNDQRTATATACRQPDGQWKVIDPPEVRTK